MQNRFRYIVIGLVLAALLMPGMVAAKTYKIGVTVIVSHPALEADQKGFEKALEEAGLKAEFDYQNAQGDMANATTIAQKFKNDDLDLVHAIATPTSQAAVKVIKNKPIVYSSVTDPVDAGLVKTMGPSGTNVTGISDAWPIERQIELYHQMVPSAKKWGTIYNAGDANSVKSISWTRDAMKKFG
ncbi:MAG: ABC transporter substrate-binding protein, partial [Desulfobacterales bacterium]|nr:ABC transporter substrate-binding protein [Desulfobacterales bacterium]